MKQLTIIIGISGLFLMNIAGIAQDTIITRDVEVIKAYQPSISEAYKIASSPKITDTVKYTPVFEYKINSTLIPVDKTIQQLPAVQLGSQPQEKGNTGFLKAGAGNAFTPYAEFLLNTPPAKTTDFGIHLYHFSSNPSVLLNNALKTKSQYSDNMASIFINNYFKKAVLAWNIKYDRTRFNYYGFPGTDSLLYRENELISNTLNKKQILSNASANFDLKKIDTRSEFVYDIKLGYNYFWNATGQVAHFGHYDGQYSIDKKNFDILIGSKLEYYNNDSIQNPYKDKLDHQYFFAHISPQIVYEKKNIYLKAGFNLSGIIDDDTTSIFHISPKIYFEYKPIKDMLTLFAGTDGNLSTNHYQSMTKKNQYLDPLIEIKPSQELFAIYGGLRGKFSRAISYLFDVSYSIRQNELFFYLKQTDYPSASDQVFNTFSAKYTDLNVLRFGGNLRYSSENVTVSLNGNYYNNTSADNTTITHLPNYDANLETIFNVSKKLRIKVASTVVGPRKAELIKTIYTVDEQTNLLGNPVIQSEISDLKTIIDINIGADYAHTKKLGFFVDIRNLINQNYEVWHGYNKQGILFLAGARYTF